MVKERHLAKRTISVQVKGCLLSSADVLKNYFEGSAIEESCKIGCPNYGRKWSCPPLKAVSSNRWLIFVCMLAVFFHRNAVIF